MAEALEIDFLPVGNNSRSGDAIAIRFGNYENGRWKTQTVFIIDGGDTASGEALVKHVNEIYHTDKVDRVILTHPDSDHASGLRTVIEELKVGKIWMHRPWNHWSDLKDSIKDGRITKKSFGERMQDAYQHAYEIEQLAVAKKIDIFHPNQGCNYKGYNQNILKVLAPGKDFYLSLIQASDKTPHMGLGSSSKLFSSTKSWEHEDMSFGTEHLYDDEGDTSAENDMSLILYLTFAGKKVLFTGDAGTMGLYKAIRYATEQGIDLNKLDLLQVPHHGSRHNISKNILEFIYAPTAVISSAPQGAPNHPSPIVTNSLLRRNINPFATQGILINYHHGAPMRTGLRIATPIPFQSLVQISDAA